MNPVSVKQLVLYIVVLLLGGNLFSQTLIPARKEKLFGFCDSTGSWIIPARYNFVKPFSQGFAVAQNEKGEFLFINEKGEPAFGKTFVEAESFENGFAYVKDTEKGYAWLNTSGQYMIHANGTADKLFLCEGMVARSNAEGKYGFTDLNGLWLVEPTYQAVYGFSDGMAPVQQNGKWGFIDRSGTLMVSCEYDDIRDFSEGMAAVSKKGLWGYVDKTGNLKIPFQYDIAEPFHDGLAQVGDGEPPITVHTALKRGFIDKTGKTVIPFAYCVYNGFSNGLAIRLSAEAAPEVLDVNGKVLFRKPGNGIGLFASDTQLAIYIAPNNKYGFIDRKGQEVIPAIYYSVESFKNGFSLVRISSREYAYIDPKGKLWLFD